MKKLHSYFDGLVEPEDFCFFLVVPEAAERHQSQDAAVELELIPLVILDRVGLDESDLNRPYRAGTEGLVFQLEPGHRLQLLAQTPERGLLGTTSQGGAEGPYQDEAATVV